jgi:hypothetical protein
VLEALSGPHRCGGRGVRSSQDAATGTPSADALAVEPAPPGVRNLAEDVRCVDGAAWHPVSAALRAAGPPVAWIGAVLAGWRSAHHADLLDAVLRGAGVWFGVLVVWGLGVSACDRLIGVRGAGTPASKGLEGVADEPVNSANR